MIYSIQRENHIEASLLGKQLTGYVGMYVKFHRTIPTYNT